MRRVLTLSTIAMALLASMAIGLFSSAVAAQDASSAEAGFVDIIEVSGLLDEVVAEFIVDSLVEAEEDGARLLVLQVNSPGSVLDDDDLRFLADRIASSPVPVAMWVGPSGGMQGATAQLAAVSSVLGIAPGTRFGNFGESVLDNNLLAARFGDQLSRLRSNAFDFEEATASGVADEGIVLGTFLLAQPQFDSVVELEDPNDPNSREVTRPLTVTRFGGLPLLDQLFHTIASPPVAYLLFIIGMALLLFELYTAGVGIAGVIGAVCFVGGCYGLSVLPTRSWAIAVLVLSIIAFGIDVQTGVPRVWTGIGTALLIVGSVMLYDGVNLSWVTLIAGIVGILTAMVSGMPSMVRTRFSTPTIGRDWMIGEMGEAVDEVAPEGRVKVHDALWRARTNRATPIELGAPVRVVAIEGLILEVEPEDGAARDYRDRSPRD